MTTTKPQSTTETLEPCPFDGGDEIVVGSRSDEGPYVRCFFCDTYVFGDTEAECIAKWNTRISPASAAPVVDVECLVDQVLIVLGNPGITASTYSKLKEVLSAAATAAPASSLVSDMKNVADFLDKASKEDSVSQGEVLGCREVLERIKAFAANSAKPSLIEQIAKLADEGSAVEFGDADERLRAIAVMVNNDAQT